MSKPTRKQPPKKKSTASKKAVRNIAIAGAVAATAATRRGGGKGKKLAIALAIIFALVVIAGSFAYLFTGKTVNFYLIDDSMIEYEEENKPWNTVKYHVFSETELFDINDCYEGDLSGWKLDWYSDEGGTTKAATSKVGFADLFAEESVYGILTETTPPPTYTPPASTPGDVPPYDGDYYDNITWTVSGLNARLHDGFTATSYAFAGKGGALITADTPLGKEKVHGIYNDLELDPDWKSGKNFEREHVWCNSLLGMKRVTSTGKNQASDLHNLRAIGGVYSGGINQTRSNRYFTDCPSTCNVDGDNKPETHPGHAVGTKAFYPGSDHVGDVSRILMYMIVMYNDILKIPASESVILDADGHAYEKEYAYMPIASRQLLIDWNKADKVDNFEKSRNEAIYHFQGNRNPFIDHEDKLETVLALIA